jgi:hypothetical protein
MQNDTPDEFQNKKSRIGSSSPRAPRRGVEMTFWTSLRKREQTRAIARAHERTLRSLLNEALDTIIAKYGSSKS